MAIQDMLQCCGCDVQHKVNQCYPLWGSWGVLWRPFSLYLTWKKMKFLHLATNHDINLEKANTNHIAKKQKHQNKNTKTSCQEPNSWQKLTTAAQYRVWWCGGPLGSLSPWTTWASPCPRYMINDRQVWTSNVRDARKTVHCPWVLWLQSTLMNTVIQVSLYE